MGPPRINLAAVLLAWCIATAMGASTSHAQLVSLPLQGHYRIGRFMPVRVEQSLAPGAPLASLSAHGAMTTSLPEGAKIDAVIPWLSVSTIHDVQWGALAPIQSLPFQPLDDDERLIAFVGADSDALASQFPGKKLVRVELDVADPLPGNILAWEALDGIVLDSIAASRINESKVRSLLTGGTIVGIRSRAKPGGDFPWQRAGDYWIAKFDVAGPRGSMVSEAYVPAQSWPRGRPDHQRYQILLITAAFSLVLTASLLLRSRWTVALAVAVCVATTAALAVQLSRRSPAIRVAGDIVVMSADQTQVDQWIYCASLGAGEQEMAWEPSLRPIFEFRKQADDLKVRLVCDEHGTPQAYRFDVGPRQTVAFQTRRFASDAKTSYLPKNPLATPLRTMADALYAGPGDKIAGQLNSDFGEQWPGVLIQRGK